MSTGDGDGDKMSALLGRYESLLESQLRDQEMYFDKILAREMIKALEENVRKQRINKNAGESNAALPRGSTNGGGGGSASQR
jgi:hypothetical protein